MMATTRAATVVAAIGILSVIGIAVFVAVNLARTVEPPPGADVSDSPAPPAGEPTVRATDCGEPTVSVGTGSQLQKALDAARPGDVIALETATFYGNFVATVSGTSDQPITLCGTPETVSYTHLTLPTILLV